MRLVWLHRRFHFPVECGELLAKFRVDRFSVRLGDDALPHETRPPHFARRGMRANELVQLRLREEWFVRLVVSPAAIANQIDQHVLGERVAIRHREPHRDETGFRVVGVHVQHRHFESLGRIARVSRGACVDWIGGEAHLIVHDQVHRPTHVIATQARKVERLRHHAFAGECGVAVNAQRQRHAHVASAWRAGNALLRARDAGHDGIHDLEMTRVRNELNRHACVAHLAFVGEPQVVFHVTRAAVGARVALASFELTKHLDV